MKSSFLNLALLAPAVAAGVLSNGLSAQAVTLNLGDVLSLATEVEVSNNGFTFEFSAPAGVDGNSNIIVTGGTGGFAPFADPSNANGPLPSPPLAYTIDDIDFTTYTQTGSLIDVDPNNNITNGEAAPLFDCPDPTNCRAIVPGTGKTPVIFLEVDALNDLIPDLEISIKEFDFIGGFELGGGTTQAFASGAFHFLSDNAVGGAGAFNATFTSSNPNGPTSVSFTFTVDELKDIPEPSSVLALAAMAGMAGMGALSLKKKSK
ncbi:MAG: PEP-CTERM sorting domain-containing protein [Crocosphaera sp.]